VFSLKLNKYKIPEWLLAGLLVVIFMHNPAPVHAQGLDLLSSTGDADDPGFLTLNDCLEIAYENNIGLMRIRLGIEASFLERIRNESIFDPGFDLNLSYRQQDSPDSTSNSSGASNTQLGMNYRHPIWNGSSWVISIDQTVAEGSYNFDEGTESYRTYNSQFGIAYSMPILEGYGERINRIGVRKSDIGIFRSESAVNNAERALRYSVIQAYILATLTAKQIEVAELSLDTAVNLVERVQALIDVGQIAPYELLSAQSGLAQRQEAVLNASTDLANSHDFLKDIIGLPIIDDISVGLAEFQGIILDVDADDLFFLAQQNRPDLEDIDLRIQQSQLDLMLATDRRQASLTWNTILSVAGQDDGYTESIGDMNHFSWYTGLEYQLPLGGNRAAVVDVSSARLALDQLDLERIELLRNLQLEIRSAVEEFNTALLRVDVTSQGLEVQDVKMESEHARLELGLITSRDLLESDLELATARLAVEFALADALNAIAKLEFLTNVQLIDDAVILGGILSDAEVIE
jgi:outer membrane protein TolC